MKTVKIAGAVILAIALLGAGMLYFKTKSDSQQEAPLYKGENIQPESHKVFFGSWILEHPESAEKQGFTLMPDSMASSINMATLKYKKWKIENDELVLTAISLGNHTASVFEEKYAIDSFNQRKMILEMNGREYIYKKLKKIIAEDSEKSASLSTSFEYFPAEKADTAKQEVDLESNARAKRFKTVISQEYNSSPVNFAGHYVVITWGCGSGCIEGVMVDSRNGKVYNLPTKKGYSDVGNSVEHYKNSVLLKTSFIYPAPDPNNQEAEEHFWLWNEAAKEFVHYKSESNVAI
ncbi:Lipocalin-like [Mariniphaga anaerophila]|uniref:Lipocalin-like n=1 Tax=Mariniphaga anaerophila TaxID=1484053 RepID=A0A1M5CEH0_9BACT|nr:lipocalin family protein [Mariniphaga anaerophila]SHF52997.1 Lipocalin-like [Mariniphaga anaerophila]